MRRRHYCLMRSRSVVFMATILGLIVLNNASGEGYAETFSDKNVTGGTITEIAARPGYERTIWLREKSTRQTRKFFISEELNPSLMLDGRDATFKDLKPGMRVQISFYQRGEFQGTFDETRGFPVSTVKALSVHLKRSPGR